METIQIVLLIQVILFVFFRFFFRTVVLSTVYRWNDMTFTAKLSVCWVAFRLEHTRVYRWTNICAGFNIFGLPSHGTNYLLM